MKKRGLNYFRLVSRKTAALIFFYLLFLLIPSPTFSASSASTTAAQETFKPVEVLRLSWGTGPEQVGLAKLPGFTYGPQSFLVDEARNIFYILDSANSRVLMLDSRKTLINFFTIDEMAKDIALDDEGTIYILYTGLNKIIAYDFSGIKKGEYLIDDRQFPVKGLHYSREIGLLSENFGGLSYLVKPRKIIQIKEKQSGQKFVGFYREGGKISGGKEN